MARVTEDQVLRVLPPRGFLRAYCEYAAHQTDAHVGYHLVIALGMLASTVPTDVGLWFGGAEERVILWPLLVGRSGVDRKSTAMRIGRTIMQDAAPQLLGKMPGSWEGLVDHLADQPRQVQFYGEFGNFLAQTSDGYMAGLRTKMMELWDGDPVSRILKGGAGTEIRDHRLSQIGGCTPKHLEDHTDASDWEGGYLSRFGPVILAYRERTLRRPPDPRKWAARREKLCKHVQYLTACSAGPLRGLSDDAADLYERFELELETQTASESRTWMHGLIARTPTIARKLSLVLSWDHAAQAGQPPPAATGKPWRVSRHHMAAAIAITRLHFQSVQEICSSISPSRHDAQRAAIVSAIGIVPRPFHEVIAEVNAQPGNRAFKRTILSHLNTLLAERRVTAYTGPGGTQLTTDPEMVPELYRAAILSRLRDDQV